MSPAFVLYDTDRESSPEAASRLDSASTGISLNGHSDWSVRRRTLQGGLSDGVEVIDLCSGVVNVSILPTRGMGLWKATRGDCEAGWASPVRRPVHPRHVDLTSRNGLGWLDGFHELLCRCGLAFNGPPGIDPGAASPIESQLTLHGRIANLPAHRVEVQIDPGGPGTLSVTGIVDECTMFGPQLRLTSTVSLSAGETSIRIDDAVENLGGSETELELLYHINVGPPFLDAGAKLVTASTEIAPRDPRAAEGIETHDVYLGPTPGYAEQAYFHRLRADQTGISSVLLHNAAGDRGFAVRFGAAELPCFTVWKCTQSERDGYVTGLEPGLNFPNFKAFEREQGRVRRLMPHEVYRTQLTLELLTGAPEVAACSEHIQRLASGTSPQRHASPAAGFSPQT